jgi:isoquinoline 1-oxidoreductase subunit beta
MAQQSSNVLRTAISRRGFLVGTAGLTFAFTITGCGQDSGQPAPLTGPAELNAWVTITPDGRITIMSPAAELGQGVMTAIPLIIAEELDADWSQVDVVQSPIQADYNNPIHSGQVVLGSVTVVGYWEPCRIAGAQARRVLMDAAALQWQVPAGEVATEAGRVVHTESGRSASYGEIAATAELPDELPVIHPEQDLKAAADFRLLGTDMPRVDVASKVDGSIRYAMDIDLPDLLFATVAPPPARDADAVSFNGDEVRALPGIVDVVELEQGVGILGRSVPEVFAARRLLDVQWSEVAGTVIDSERDLREYLEHVRDDARVNNTSKVVGFDNGALADVDRVVSREFTNDYVYHAQMEPTTCTAWVRDNTVEVWAGSQQATRGAEEAARLAGVTAAQVVFHQLPVGGGFGRRLFVDYVQWAVQLSRAAGAPVKLIQTREDDLLDGRFRPMAAQRVEAYLDAAGTILAWNHRIAAEPVVPYIYGPERWEAQAGFDHVVTWGSELPYYAIANQRTEHVYENRGARVAPWRGIGAGYTNFANESLIDELAVEAGEDPLAYRVALVNDERARRVLERVAGMCDWGRARNGTALGVAFTKYGAAAFGHSLSAAVAEISVNEETGRIRVHDYWIAVDPGLPLQPRNVVAQVEGSVVFALGAALTERITIRNGRVVQSNFGDYQVMRMADIPQIHVDVIRGSDQPQQVGELGVPTVAPAIANAFFALTGRRLRHLPMSPDKVLEALRG